MVMDVEGVGAAVALAKSCFDAVRNLVGLVKDVQGFVPEGEKKDAIRLATAEVEKQAALAEVEWAAALGYKLCRCEFPPTPMLKVGWIEVPRPHTKGGGMVEQELYRCPKCQALDKNHGRIHMHSGDPT